MTGNVWQRPDQRTMDWANLSQEQGSYEICQLKTFDWLDALTPSLQLVYEVTCLSTVDSMKTQQFLNYFTRLGISIDHLLNYYTRPGSSINMDMQNGMLFTPKVAKKSTSHLLQIL